MQKQYEKKNVWKKSNEAYLLSIRVQTMINHISICFFTTISTTAWWRLSGNLKGRENSDDLKPHGDKNSGKRIQAREVDQLSRSQGHSARQGYSSWQEKVTALCAS